MVNALDLGAFGRLEPLYGVDGTLTKIVAYGLAPEGLRVDAFLEGTCYGDEPFAHAGVTGVSYLNFRLDGVATFEFRADIHTVSGLDIAGTVLGYAIPPDDFVLPSPADVLEPDFAWPDVWFRVSAFITYRTDHALAWLNRTVVAAEGGVNPGLREFSHKMSVLRPPLG